MTAQKDKDLVWYRKRLCECKGNEKNALLAGTQKLLLLSNQAFLNIKKLICFCALWSILVKKFPMITNQICISGYKQPFYKLQKSGIDFSNGLRIENIPKFESKSNLILNVF